MPFIQPQTDHSPRRTQNRPFKKVSRYTTKKKTAYVITIANLRRQRKVVPEQKMWWLYFIATRNEKNNNLKNKKNTKQKQKTKNNSCSTFFVKRFNKLFPFLCHSLKENDATSAVGTEQCKDFRRPLHWFIRLDVTWLKTRLQLVDGRFCTLVLQHFISPQRFLPLRGKPVAESFLFSGCSNLFVSFRKEDILLVLPSSACMPIEFVRDFVSWLHPVSDILRGVECCTWSAVRLDSKCHFHVLQCELHSAVYWKILFDPVGHFLTGQ